MQNEIWKPITLPIDLTGRYEISNFGRIKSTIGTTSKLLSVEDPNRKYFDIRIRYNGGKRTLKIHRLVALHFIPNPANKPYVNHKDMDKHNNHFYNLEWCTPSENSIHAIKTGPERSTLKLNQFDLNGNLVKTHNSVRDAAITNNCNYNTFRKAIQVSPRNYHKGFVYNYA